MEIVDIVNNEGIVLYQETKEKAHGEGLLHKTVIAEVINSQGEILLIKPNSHKQDAGQFVSPVGGHVTAGESNEDALKRETHEEIGLTDFNYSFVGKAILDRHIIGRHENHMFFVYEIYSDCDPILSNESISFQWFTKAQLITELANNRGNFGEAYLFVLKNFYKDLLVEGV
jgi:8-oxo-dGTP pyrophosphatase MutT (NUDIX family)